MHMYVINCSLVHHRGAQAKKALNEDTFGGPTAKGELDTYIQNIYILYTRHLNRIVETPSDLYTP